MSQRLRPLWDLSKRLGARAVQPLEDIVRNRQEALGGNRAELHAPLARDLGEREVGAELVSIGPLRCHGIVGVADRDDLSDQRDSLP